jgi:hypothetical protein
MEGVDEPNSSMDASVRMALIGLGCKAELCDRGVTFSLDYVQTWASGTIGTSRLEAREYGQRSPESLNNVSQH